MIELKKNFIKKGVNYEQLFKSQEIVVYKCERTDGTDTYYEVFKYRTKEPDRFHDDVYECYPNDESFGNWAWCCSNKNSVLKVLDNNFDLEDIPMTTEEFTDLLLGIAK